jgi:hypothetical protein
VIPSVEPSPSATRSVLQEGTDIVYQRRFRALFSHLFVGVLPLFIGWSVPWNLPLVGVLVAYFVVGLLSTRRYGKKARTQADARRWALWLYVKLAALGLIYDAIFVNLALHGVPRAMEYLLLLTALFCAGAAATYQYLRGLAIVFIVAVTAPQVVYHLLSLQDALARGLWTSRRNAVDEELKRVIAEARP